MEDVFRYVKFIKGTPMLFVKRERYIAVGDLHIGTELKMRERGIYVAGGAEGMARRINAACEAMHADGIVLLGDIKESLSYPLDEEKMEILRFFAALNEKNVMIAKGNHDAYIERIIDSGTAKIEKEIILKDVALVHGNAVPSNEALSKKVLVVAHGHMSIERNGTREKVWVIAKGRKRGSYAVVVSAFNDLITGSDISEDSGMCMPLIRNGMYDFGTAEIYSLGGKSLGGVGEYIREKEREA